MQLGPGRHVLVLVALVVNLWVGGAFIEAWLGWGARQAFEFALILGYIWFVVGITVPLPWRRPAQDAPRREQDDDIS